MLQVGILSVPLRNTAVFLLHILLVNSLKVFSFRFFRLMFRFVLILNAIECTSLPVKVEKFFIDS